LGKQNADMPLTEEEKAAFFAVCGDVATIRMTDVVSRGELWLEVTFEDGVTAAVRTRDRDRARLVRSGAAVINESRRLREKRMISMLRGTLDTPR
jgi:hypothetical protein